MALGSYPAVELVQTVLFPAYSFFALQVFLAQKFVD